MTDAGLQKALKYVHGAGQVKTMHYQTYWAKCVVVNTWHIACAMG